MRKRLLIRSVRWKKSLLCEVSDVKKRMIVVAMGFLPVVLINPEIISKSGEYEAEDREALAEYKRQVGARITAMRKEKGMTQEMLAEEVGMNPIDFGSSSIRSSAKGR